MAFNCSLALYVSFEKEYGFCNRTALPSSRLLYEKISMRALIRVPEML